MWGHVMRRAKQLKPETFPFLAVLLCAMGSLILMLLVMDRRAKAVARAKAQRAAAQVAALDEQTQAEPLAELRAARERAQHTYSLVPYRGKRGENRRPVYVECTSQGLVFHPDKETVIISSAGLRGEVAHRLARQQATAPASAKNDTTPYV